MEPQMTDEQQWLMRIEGNLSAHFRQPDGTSRPGTDWAVGLKRGEATFKVMVRAYLGEGLSPALQADTQYQGQTVLGYISDLLAKGWTPDRQGPLEITVLNPPAEEPN
jgi:hypothetical protein